MIYNPSAGGLNGRPHKRIEKVIRVLRECGHAVTPLATRGPCTAGGIARQSIADGADLILVAGGDGTINEVLNGMVYSETPLGVLPGGTANVLANELRLGGEMEKVARGVGSWQPRRIPVGLLQTGAAVVPRYFLLMAGVGFDAHVVNHVNLDLKKRHGKLSYWIAGFQELGRRLEEFEVRIEDKSYRCSFALVSRVRNYGGTFEFARHASLLAGDFAVVLLEGSSAFRYLKYLAGVLTGRLGKISGVSLLRANRLEFAGAPGQWVYVQVDGEAAGRLPATVEIVPDALTLLAPPHFTE